MDSYRVGLLAFCLALLQLVQESDSLQWPAGKYGLPQAQSGCPAASGFTWRTGYRYHDLSDTRPYYSECSPNCHLAANINNNNVRHDFCLKTDNSTDTGRPNWPKGTYCIYRKGGSCPPGFSTGWIKWDDENTNNNNKLGGTVPDGVYNKDTVIHYCCREDGDTKTLMSLPSDRDFFLLAYKTSVCQKVEWFIESTEWLLFDTESVWQYNNQGGSHPFLENWTDRKIYYCYYKRAPTTPPPPSPSPTTAESTVQTTAGSSTSVTPTTISSSVLTTETATSVPVHTTATATMSTGSTSAIPTQPPKYQDAWPAGLYGLPEAISGCPVSSDTSWETGFRFQDTDDGRVNNRSADFHLAANVGHNIRRDFCMKTRTDDDHLRYDWPRGTYCIYRKGTLCPVGFDSGWIFWDDEYVSGGNGNQAGGALPDGYYGYNTRIYYCCREDGNKTSPMVLPTRDNFFLIAYRSAECQKVQWMVESSEFIQFATDPSYNGDDTDQGGAHPFNATGPDHTLFYCYYQGCKIVLTDQSGRIQSPRHPQNYSANQQCSWTITPSNVSAIHLNFTSFSMQTSSGCTADSLRVYDGASVTSPLLGVFCGGNPPPEDGLKSSGPAVFLEFQSDDAVNFQGFVIIYTNTTQEPTPKPSALPPTELPPRSTGRPNTGEPTVEPGKGSSEARASDDGIDVVTAVVPVVLIIILLLVLLILGYIWVKRRRDASSSDQSMVDFIKGLTMKDLINKENGSMNKDPAHDNPTYDTGTLTHRTNFTKENVIYDSSDPAHAPQVLSANNCLYDSTGGFSGQTAGHDTEDLYTEPRRNSTKKYPQNAPVCAKKNNQEFEKSVVLENGDVYALPVPKGLRKTSGEAGQEESHDKTVTLENGDVYALPVPKHLRKGNREPKLVNAVDEDEYAIAGPAPANRITESVINPIYG